MLIHVGLSSILAPRNLSFGSTLHRVSLVYYFILFLPYARHNTGFPKLRKARMMKTPQI